MSYIINLPQINRILRKCNSDSIEIILERNELSRMNEMFEIMHSQTLEKEIDKDILQKENNLIKTSRSKTVICVSDENYSKLTSFLSQMEIGYREFKIDQILADSKGDIIEVLKIGDVKREQNYSGNNIEWNVFACPFSDPGKNEVLFSRFARINNATTSRCHLIVSSENHFLVMFRLWKNKNARSLQHIRAMKSEITVMTAKGKTPQSLYDICFDDNVIQKELNRGDRG